MSLPVSQAAAGAMSAGSTAFPATTLAATSAATTAATPAATAAATPLADADPSAGALQRLDIRFTGSAGAYWRLWMVGQLLTLLSLGLYYPWAKVQRLRYQAEHTLVDGHPLSFHGQGLALLGGQVLMQLLAVGYLVAVQQLPLLAALAGGALALLWPALWRGGLRYRLTHTRWRGLPLQFHGSLAGAYRVLAPVALWLLGAAVLVSLGYAEIKARPPGSEAPAAEPSAFGLAIGALSLLLVLSLLVLPSWVRMRLLRYRQDHLGFADQRSHLTLSGAEIYKLYGRNALRWAAAALGSAAVVALAAATAPSGEPGLSWRWSGLALLSLLALLLLPALWSWAEASTLSATQNLVWSRTGSARITLDSQLPQRALFLTLLKGWWLTLLTLGLYRPALQMHLLRLRLQSVRLSVRGGCAALVALQAVGARGAAAESVGDALGVDFGIGS